MHLCVRELALLLPHKLRRRPVELLCQRYGHQRLTLPEVDPEIEFPGFGDVSVTVRVLPNHFWTSPLVDQIAVTKIAKVLNVQRILEIGSFQGHTALMLADNTQADITAVDVLENHGEIYRDRIQGRIRRLVGTIERVPERERFDFIFLDADHRADEVERDTRFALERLAPGGVLLWHDYCDSLWITKLNRVPEVLADYAQKLEIRGLRGTKLAVYRSGVPRPETGRAAVPPFLVDDGVS
jgi:SAM-dependent methyltransferase